ncbi:MAG TPA: hypothetical protein VIK63_05025 [Haloplasmataceae bacterium]
MLLTLLGLDIQFFYWLIGIICVYLILKLHLNAMKDQVLIEGLSEGYRYRIIKKEPYIQKIMDILLIVAIILIIQHYMSNRIPIYIFKV